MDHDAQTARPTALQRDGGAGRLLEGDTVVALEGWAHFRVRGAKPADAERVLEDVLSQEHPDLAVKDVLVQFRHSPLGAAWDAEVRLEGRQPGLRRRLQEAVPAIEQAFTRRLARLPGRIR